MDYILVCGDFNCVLKNDVDIISVERVVLKFNDLLSDCDLHDTWRLFHPEGKEYISCKRNPFVARRLDYILTIIIKLCVLTKPLNVIFILLPLQSTEDVLF